MRVIDIENIVTNMKDDTRFVLRCEEVFHDKISSAAAAILSAQPRKPFVCLTGPSGSGKTTTAMRLQAYLENLGVKVCLLSMDNFFLPLSERPKDLTDWESPLCVNRQLLLGTIEKLSNGETVQVPAYVAEVLEQSMAQDNATANLIERESSAYAAEAKARNI